MSHSLVELSAYTLLLYGLLLAWAALNARLLFRGREGVRRETSGSRWVLGIVSGAGIVAAAVAYDAAHWAAIPAPRVAFWGGAALVVAGAALREYAVRTLGRYFTVDLAADANQPVVDVGPYAYVRHPGYTGAAITLVGVGLVLANWLSLAIVVVSVGVGYWYRIRVEERLLRAELGEAYDEYTECTPYRLIPGLW